MSSATAVFKNLNLNHFREWGNGGPVTRIPTPASLKEALNILYKLNASFAQPKIGLAGDAVIVQLKLLPEGLQKINRPHVVYNNHDLELALRELFNPWLKKISVLLIRNTYLTRSHYLIEIEIIPAEDYTIEQILSFQFRPPIF